MSESFYFESKDKEMLAATKAYGEKFEAWLAAVRALGKEVGREPVIVQYKMMGYEFLGFRLKRGEAETTDAWRGSDWVLDEAGATPYLRPRKTTAAGKALLARMESVGVRHEDVRAILVGMPKERIEGSRWLTPGVHVMPEAKRILVTYGVEVQPDGKKWRALKASEYHKILEREEAKVA